MQLTRMLDRTTKHVNDLIDHTTSGINPSRQIQAHPWLMVGGALCAGYALGLLERSTRHERHGIYPYYPAGANASPVMPSSSQQGARTPQPDGIYDYYPRESSQRREPRSRNDHTLWHRLAQDLGPETEEAKQMVMQLGRGLFVELTRRMIPDIARALGVTLSPATAHTSTSASPAPGAPQSPHRSEEKGGAPSS